MLFSSGLFTQTGGECLPAREVLAMLCRQGECEIFLFETRICSIEDVRNRRMLKHSHNAPDRRPACIGQGRKLF
jgi:hypothetical protein